MADHAELFHRASLASGFLQRSQANQAFGNSANDMQKLAQRSPNNLQTWWNSNPEFQSQVAQNHISTANLNFSNPQTVVPFTNQIHQIVASGANYMNQYTSQAYRLINVANSVRSSAPQSQADEPKVSRSESDSISASVSSASTSASEANNLESTAPLTVDKQPEKSFWTPVKSAEDQDSYFRNVDTRYSRRNRYKNRRPHPSYTMYSSMSGNKHGSRNKYGFNILDYCDYANIPYKNISGNEYKILSSGSGHGDFSSLVVSQTPNHKRVPNGHGGYSYVNAHDGRTYSQLNRFSTKLSGLRGLDSLTQFIMNYNDWDKNPGPNDIKAAKKRRNHFFKVYAAEGHFQTGHPYDSSGIEESHEVHNATGKHNHHVSKNENLTGEKWQMGYNEDVHFADSVMRAYKGAFNSHYTQNKMLRRYENITHMPAQQAQRQLQDYKVLLKRSIRHGTTMAQEMKKDPYRAEVGNNEKELTQVYNYAINDTNNFVNKNVVDNSIAMNYLHNKRGIDKGIVNYLISRGLVKGLQSDTYTIHVRDPKTHKRVAKKVTEDPRVEFLHRIPDTPQVAHRLKNPLSNRPQQTSSDLYLTKGVQEEKPSGADLIYLKKYSYRNPKTHRITYYYDKDHQAYGNSKKVDKNSLKNYGWNFRIGNGKDRLYVFEAPIDAISFAELHRNHPELLHNSTFLALGGADSKSKTIQNFINAQFPTKGQYKHIIVAPDNDWAGYELVQDVMGEFGDRIQYVNHRSKNQKLVTSEVPLSDNGTIDRKYAYQKKHGIKVNGRISPFNKDWNEMLQKQNFYNVKFTAPGKPLNADQYGQHTVNQFMELLNKSDQQKFDVMANIAGKIQSNDRASSELIDKNNPRIKMMTKAYYSMSSQLNAMQRITGNKVGAHIELMLYNKMGNRTHSQKMKLFKKSNPTIRSDYVKNYNAIKKISATSYGKEKFDKFMTNAGQFLSGTDMARYANKAYIAMYSSRNKMLNNPTVQKNMAKPYPKPTPQLQTESFMNTLPSVKAQKLFTTAVRSTHNITERTTYMKRHPRLFQTRKNIYNAQIGIDKLACSTAYKKLLTIDPQINTRVQNLMKQLINDRVKDRYGTVYKYASQWMHKQSEFPYTVQQVVKGTSGQNKVKFYKRDIDFNNKKSWDDYRRYAMSRGRKDPAKVYQQRRQSRKAFYKRVASGKPFVTKGVSSTYIKAMKVYHRMLVGTRQGRQVIDKLHSRGITNKQITSKMLGYAPDTPILGRALRNAGIKPQDLKASHLMINGKDRFNNQIIYPDIQYRGNKAVGIRRLLGRYTNGQAQGQVLVQPNTMKPRKPKQQKQAINLQGKSGHAKTMAQKSNQFMATLTKRSVMPAYQLIHDQINAKLTKDPKDKKRFNDDSIDQFKQLSKKNQTQFSKMHISSYTPKQLGELIDMNVKDPNDKSASNDKTKPKIKPKQHQVNSSRVNKQAQVNQNNRQPINNNAGQRLHNPAPQRNPNNQNQNVNPNNNQQSDPQPNNIPNGADVVHDAPAGPTMAGIDMNDIPPEDADEDSIPPEDADKEIDAMNMQNQQAQNQQNQQNMVNNANQNNQGQQDSDQESNDSNNRNKPNDPSHASNNTKHRMNSIVNSMNNIGSAIDKGHANLNQNHTNSKNKQPSKRPVTSGDILRDTKLTKKQKVQALRKKWGFAPK